MGIRFQTEIKINLKAILRDSILLVSEKEIKKEIRAIVLFWAEQRLIEEGWPLPSSTKDIREHLIENSMISEEDGTFTFMEPELDEADG
ncbi:hypothetical protein [Paenibacillus silviterrae]|uniref:hypothetical protein n=1 Tax=Paenibacillus silviterrae TaxID=3242194 RepID=UPI0025431AF7|nr:hypothetical protein [Paenibacillus chinjuensis]